MTDAEKLFSTISDISMEKDIGLFDALLLFLDENNIDVEDIIPIFDTNIIEKLKIDALKTNIVCNRKMFEVKTTSLF